MAGTVDGDFGSGEMPEVAAGFAGDAELATGVVADVGVDEADMVEGETGDCDVDVACGVMVCTDVATSVVRTRDLLGIVIVLVFDAKDVWVEGSYGAGFAMELELENV